MSMFITQMFVLGGNRNSTPNSVRRSANFLIDLSDEDLCNPYLLSFHGDQSHLTEYLSYDRGQSCPVDIDNATLYYIIYGNR